MAVVLYYYYYYYYQTLYSYNKIAEGLKPTSGTARYDYIKLIQSGVKFDEVLIDEQELYGHIIQVMPGTC